MSLPAACSFSNVLPNLFVFQHTTMKAGEMSIHYGLILKTDISVSDETHCASRTVLDDCSILKPILCINN